VNPRFADATLLEKLFAGCFFKRRAHRSFGAFRRLLAAIVAFGELSVPAPSLPTWSLRASVGHRALLR
jgi:hypothetical protein